nr:MAG TPA: hypothetical protein [Caudoviricetes sp.]
MRPINGGCSRGTICNSVFPAAGVGGVAEDQQIIFQAVRAFVRAAFLVPCRWYLLAALSLPFLRGGAFLLLCSVRLSVAF